MLHTGLIDRRDSSVTLLMTCGKGEIMTTLNIGDSAPEFELPKDDGSVLSLSALRGSKVVLYFYPKDDTTGCTQEAIEFNQLRGEFAAKNTKIIGVSPDATKSHVKFKTKHSLDLTLISDESKAMLEAYGVWAEKSMYGRKYMGVERTTFLIDEAGKITQIWAKVKVPGHAAEVLSKLQP